MADCIDHKKYEKPVIVDKMQAYREAYDIVCGKSSFMKYIYKYGDMYLDEIFGTMLQRHKEDNMSIMEDKLIDVEIDFKQHMLAQLTRNIELTQEVIDDESTTEEERKDLKELVSELKEQASRYEAESYQSALEREERRSNIVPLV